MEWPGIWVTRETLSGLPGGSCGPTAMKMAWAVFTTWPASGKEGGGPLQGHVHAQHYLLEKCFRTFPDSGMRVKYSKTGEAVLNVTIGRNRGER